MSSQTGRRSPPSSSSSAPGDGPKLSIEGRNTDGSLNLKVTVPGMHGSTYVLPRGSDVRPLQFEGEVVAEVERDGSERGPTPRSFVTSYRAAIYKTRGGKFVTEFSSVNNTGDRTGKADVFGTLDEACEWFRPGPLTTELLKKLRRWEPEVIE